MDGVYNFGSKATALSSRALMPRPGEVIVDRDETNGGKRTVYFFDGETFTQYGGASSSPPSDTTGTMSIPVLGAGTVVSAVSGGVSPAITYAGSAWTIGADGAVYRDGARQSTGAGAPFSKLLLKAGDGHLYGLTTANLWWSEGAPWTNVGATDPRTTMQTVTTVGSIVIPAWVTGKIASEQCQLFPAMNKFAIAAGAPGAKAQFKDAATAQTIISLCRNGVVIGTATVAVGGTTATFSLPNTVVFDPATNDYYEVIGPATPDATLGRGTINIVGALIQS